MATRTRKTRSTARSQGDGGRLNRDYSEEDYREPGEGYNGEQPTKGLYAAKLTSVADHTKQDEDEATSVKWRFELVEGSENKHGDDVSGFPDFIYTNENTLWKEQQILVALGLIKPGGKVNLPYDQIVKKAKPCTVRIGLERYVPEDGSDPEWRGRMNAFMPPKDGSATSRRKKDEPVEDLDDDIEDEDETTDDWPEDPDELAAALEDLSLVELKKVARDDFEVKVARGMKADDIIEAILDTLEEAEDDEEDEPEEEPEPPKRSRRKKPEPEPEPEDEDEDEEEEKPKRRTRSAKPSAGRTRRARGAAKGSDDEPPF